MLASFIMASCSIARVENLSTSRSRSVGFAGGWAGGACGCASACSSAVATAAWESNPLVVVEAGPLVGLRGEELVEGSSSFSR